MTLQALDPSLPHLQAAMDPATMLPILAGDLPDAVSLEASVMSRKEGRRCIIAYTLRDAAGQRVAGAAGKLFADPRRASRLWRLLTAFAKDASQPVPQPLHFDADRGLVVYEWLAGTRLDFILTKGAATDAIAATRQTAEALVRFHAASPPEGKGAALAVELVNLRANAALVEEVDAGIVGRTRELIDRIEALRLPAVNDCLVHTGFRPNAVFVTPERAAFLDLDGWAIGDPAIDVGGFVADTWREASLTGNATLLTASEALRSTYVASAPASDALEERVILYEAFDLMRLSLRDLHGRRRRKDRPAKDSDGDALLDRASALLTSL